MGNIQTNDKQEVTERTVRTVRDAAAAGEQERTKNAKRPPPPPLPAGSTKKPCHLCSTLSSRVMACVFLNLIELGKFYKKPTCDKWAPKSGARMRHMYCCASSLQFWM